MTNTATFIASQLVATSTVTVSTSAAGHLLIIGVYTSGSSTPGISVSGASLTWRQIGTTLTGIDPGNGAMGIFYAYASSQLSSQTITASVSAGTVVDMYIAEISGPTACDGAVGATGSNGASANVVTGASNDWCFGIYKGAGLSQTAGTGFTLQPASSSSNTMGGLIANAVTAAAGASVTVSYTNGSTSNDAIFGISMSFAPTPTKGTIQLLQSTSAAYSAVSSIAITVPAMTSGSGCYIALDSTGTTVNRISSITGGGIWQRAISNTSGTCTAEIWYLENATPGTVTVTVTLAATLTGQYHYAEFSGILSSGSLDASVAGTGTGATSGYSASSGNTGTVVQEVELVMEFDASVVSGSGNVGINSLPSGYTNITRLGNASPNTSAFNYQIRTGPVGVSSASTTVTGAFTAGNTCVIIATFKAVVNVMQARQNVSTGAGGTTTATVSITAPRPGNFMFMVTDSASTSDAVTSIVQTNATWTKAIAAYGSGQSPNASGELWYSANASASAGTSIVVTWASTGTAAQFSEFYGVSALSPLDQTVAATGSTSSVVWGTTSTTTVIPELAIGTYSALFSGSATALTNGYIFGADSGSTGRAGYVYNVLSSLQTTTTAATITTTAGGWVALLATFKGAGTVTATASGSSMLLLGVG